VPVRITAATKAATFFFYFWHDPLPSAGRIGGMNGLALAHGRADPRRCTRAGWQTRMNIEPQTTGPEQLIRAIATHGDRTAFTALFLRFAPRVKAYLIQLGLDPGSAEELAQEALLLVWRKAAQYDPERASASAWIFTIARNLRIDVARRTRLAMPVLDPVDEPPQSPPADAILAEEDRGIRLRAALASLPAEQAEVIRLSYFDDRPHADIERVLGIPLGTVKSRLRLAMLRLRALLEGNV
jgi:RNA polymerase sigma-70 factor, ECF subfamily